MSNDTTSTILYLPFISTHQACDIEARLTSHGYARLGDEASEHYWGHAVIDTLNKTHGWSEGGAAPEKAEWLIDAMEFGRRWPVLPEPAPAPISPLFSAAVNTESLANALLDALSRAPSLHEWYTHDGVLNVNYIYLYRHSKWDRPVEKGEVVLSALTNEESAREIARALGGEWLTDEACGSWESTIPGVGTKITLSNVVLCAPRAPAKKVQLD